MPQHTSAHLTSLQLTLTHPNLPQLSTHLLSPLAVLCNSVYGAERGCCGGPLGAWCCAGVHPAHAGDDGPGDPAPRAARLLLRAPGQDEGGAPGGGLGNGWVAAAMSASGDTLLFVRLFVLFVLR